MFERTTEPARAADSGRRVRRAGPACTSAFAGLPQDGRRARPAGKGA